MVWVEGSPNPYLQGRAYVGSSTLIIVVFKLRLDF